MIAQERFTRKPFSSVFPKVEPGLLSVIIPTFNEQRTIARTLSSLTGEQNIEVIVADGGSTDNTVEIARQFTSNVIPCRKGRGRQMNAGAVFSRGDSLMFLHADSQPPVDFANTVRAILKRGATAGAFKLGIDDQRSAFRWVEAGSNIRSRLLQMPYGDQSLFLSAEVFFQVGGFRNWPLMEDYDLCRRLRELGEIALAAESITTSARRWRQRGIVRTTLLNQLLIAAFRIGVSPERLARWYRWPAKPAVDSIQIPDAHGHEFVRSTQQSVQ